MPIPKIIASALRLAFVVTFLGASCGHSALAILPGVVNDPANLSLRRAILSYGTNQICSEMLKRSVPIKLRDEDPVTGRFFATTCFAQELANQNMFLQFSGYGYVWTNITKRMGFELSGAVEYDHDFQMDGSTMYVYFRQKSMNAANFRTRFIEQPQAAAIGALPVAGGAGQPPTNFANTFGEQIIKNEAGKGFTVIRDTDGTVQFGTGVVAKGKRPQVPYRIGESGRAVLANERTEVHQSQRDYIGPIEVTGKGQALYLTAAVDGAPGADILLIPKATADTWLQSFTSQAELTPLPAYPTLDDAVTAGIVWRRTVPLPAGLYYVVVDNTAVAGRTNPPNIPQDDRAALVSYAIELGDAP
jgi:hypothetical protein